MRFCCVREDYGMSLHRRSYVPRLWGMFRTRILCPQATGDVLDCGFVPQNYERNFLMEACDPKLQGISLIENFVPNTEVDTSWSKVLFLILRGDVSWSKVLFLILWGMLCDQSFVSLYYGVCFVIKGFVPYTRGDVSWSKVLFLILRVMLRDRRFCSWTTGTWGFCAPIDHEGCSLIFWICAPRQHLVVPWPRERVLSLGCTCMCVLFLFVQMFCHMKSRCASSDLCSEVVFPNGRNFANHLLTNYKS